MCQCSFGGGGGGRHGEPSFNERSNAIIAFPDIRSVIETSDTTTRSRRTYSPKLEPAFCRCSNVLELNFNMVLAAAPPVRYFQESTFATSFGSGKVMVASILFIHAAFLTLQSRWNHVVLPVIKKLFH